MTDAQLQQFQALLDAARAAWAEIVRIAREIVASVCRWYWTTVRPIMRAFGLVPSEHRPQTIRKIRRMRLYRAQVGRRGSIRRRGSIPPVFFDPLMN